MKKSFFLGSAFALVLFTLFAFNRAEKDVETNNTISLFPEYSESMTLDFQCEANCLFVSCTSTSEGCSCQCRGLFKCSCSVGSGDNQASVDKISINPEQYLRLKKFSETLLSLNDENANLANEALIGVVESVKTRDDNKFKFNLSALKSLLKQLSFDSKSEVNTFLKSLNSKFSLI